METQTRILIDYATGENWEMPLALYEKYQHDAFGMKDFKSSLVTKIQFWMTTLSTEEKQMITKK